MNRHASRLTIILLGAILAVPGWAANAATTTTNADPFRSALPGQLTTYEYLHLSAPAFRNALATGEPFTLSLAGNEYNLRLSESPVFTPDAVVMTLDEQGDAVQLHPALTTFKATVDDQPDAYARFSLVGDDLSGMVSLDNGWFFIEQVKQFAPTAPDDLYFTFNAWTVHASGSLEDDQAPPAPDAGDLVTTAGSTAGSTGSTTSGTTTTGSGASSASGASVSICRTCSTTSPPLTSVDVYVDGYFLNAFGGMTWPNEASKIINYVSGIYSSQIGFGYRVPGMYADTRLDRAYITEAHDALDSYHPQWQTSSQMRTLFSGNDYSWCSMGISWQGGRSSANQFVYDRCHPAVNVDDFIKTVIVAHEWGHNHNSDHPDAATLPNGCVTVMGGSMFDCRSQVFSDTEKSHIGQWHDWYGY